MVGPSATGQSLLGESTSKSDRKVMPVKFFLYCLVGLFAELLTCEATLLTLADYGVRLNGVTTFPTRSGALPSGVSGAGFESATGLGSVVINFRSPGPHSVALFVDHEIDQATNTFFNEFGARSGVPTPGLTWEIDEPGYRFGNLFTNFLAGRLDNSNGVSSVTRNDVAMALAWNFTLGPNQTALVRMILSETTPTNSFYLSQTDPQSQRTIYFSSTLEISAGDTEPPVITCPSNIVAQADPGSCFNSSVSYNATATDNSPGVTVACLPPSGARFNVGVTSVNCVATDTAGNTNHCGFTVTVRPPPPVIQCPGNLIVECALPSGKQVGFNVPASSPCDPNVVVQCQPPSGSVFPIGATAVNCTATDTAGSRSECGFSVFLVSSSTNCLGDFSLLKETCLAGEVRADPLLQPYPCGTCVEVTGVPADGWTFMGWLGDARGANQTAQLTMTQNKCVEAVFGTPISVAPAANGTAWLDPVAPLYPCGTQTRALARPNQGYFFSHWTNSMIDTANPLDFTVSQTNAVLTPVFRPLPAGQFSLAIETRGNGVVRGRTGQLLSLYPTGSNVFLRASPGFGQDFLGWSFDGPGANQVGLMTNNPISVLMDTNRNIIARFTERPQIEIVRCQGELVKGLFRFKVLGKVLETFIIEASPRVDDPTAWREVGRATNILGAVQYEDPYLPNVKQRFYRARVAGAECAGAPTLTAQRTGGLVALEWPSTTCQCVLEESQSMDAPVSWKTVSVSVQSLNGTNRVTLNAANGTRYYRLVCLP